MTARPGLTARAPASKPTRVYDRVHVVTVMYNNAATVQQFLRGIAASADRIAGLTIVDNSSTDDTVARLRGSVDGLGVPVEVIENDNAGFAGGYAAAGVSAVSRAEPVLCLNPDVVLGTGAIDAMLDVLNSFPRAAVATVPLVEPDGTPDTASRRRLPTLHASVLYSVLGKLTPKMWRYNRRESDGTGALRTVEGRRVSPLQATTGALMMVAPDFRSLDDGLFDVDYWMYGEDLQLCADAHAAGRSVLIAEVPPSVHVKGVSSGRPRSRRSNRAFHDAMLMYAKKNLVRSRVVMAFLAAGVEAHFLLSEARAVPSRIRRRRALDRSATPTN